MSREISVTITAKGNHEADYCFIDNESGDMRVISISLNTPVAERRLKLGEEIESWGMITMDQYSKQKEV